MANGTAHTLDHLVYASPDLDAAIERLERLTGIRATPGGQHPGWGTRNALIALGGDAFLEVIGPDPDQHSLERPRVFGIEALREPRLVTWAAKATDLPGLVARAEGAGIPLGAVAAGRRQRPDGALLAWRFTDPWVVVADGIVPFFIDWGETPHPAGTAVAGARMIAFRAVHPDADTVRSMLTALGLDLPVAEGRAPALVATLDTPNGRVELR